jgi:hypothetical protein
MFIGGLVVPPRTMICRSRVTYESVGHIYQVLERFSECRLHKTQLGELSLKHCGIGGFVRGYICIYTKHAVEGPCVAGALKYT